MDRQKQILKAFGGDKEIILSKAEKRKDSMINNLVDYEAGRTILETALGIIRKKDIKQTELF